MKRLYFLFFFFLAQISLAQISENISLLHEYNRGDARYSGSWIYVDGVGNEYGLIGAYSGTAIYALDNDYPELGFIEGPGSNWREITVLGDYAYVVTEGLGEGEGLQVIYLGDLPESVQLVNTLDSTFQKGHIIQKAIFEETPYIYVAGTNTTTGVHIFDCSDPELPVEVGVYNPGYYIHDVHIRGNLMFAAAIFNNLVDIVDISNPEAPEAISNFEDPGSFTHSFSTSPDLKYIFIADEKDGYPMRIWNIEDIYDPYEVGTYTANLSSLVHNPYTNGIFTTITHNTEGLRILDSRDPELVFEVGYYDTYEGDSGGFFGLWSACPYLPSGRIIGADRTRGLMVWSFDGTQASRIYGQVLDINTNQLISDAQIMLVEEDSILSSSGTFKYVNKAGDYALQIIAPGYPVLDTIITMMEGDSLQTTYFLGTTTHTHSTTKAWMNSYPNPSYSGWIQIHPLPACRLIKVYSNNGQLVQEQDLKHQTMVDLMLPKGNFKVIQFDQHGTILARENILVIH